MSRSPADRPGTSALRRCGSGRSERTSGRSPARRPTRRTAFRPPARSAGYATGRPFPARRIHLVDRALDYPAGHPVDLDLVPQLQEHEVRGQRLRPAQTGATRRTPQHLPEVHVRVSGFHVPQRPFEPGPDPVQVSNVPADGAIRQARRGLGRNEPGQYVGLEPLQFLTRRGRPVLTQALYDRQRCRPEPPRLSTGTVDRSGEVRTLQESRSYVTGPQST